ncbi:hypothetical protein CYMTET_18061 [Cymbomonas tetramitiformis]|uniref:Propionate--CoA ligase n=1 Tax=Cymbomonas tetramitiformis TaxID=36881 RepID=A0AAE0G930_9CHLO|nr:hypothetical protein CYMTET_18061 [Cymbomonas tetramitiformis]
MALQAQYHKLALEDPEEYWAQAANSIFWYNKWSKVLDFSNPPFSRWFVGATTNTCYNCIDRHIEYGRGDQLALIYDSPVTNTVEKYTYLQLRDTVAKFAGVLQKHGVGYQDRVIIYMPMIPEAVVAMMACGRIGAIHSVVFGGFAPKELATRIDDATPKLLVTASCGVEGIKILPYLPLVKEAIQIAAHKPSACIVKQRPQCVATLVPNVDFDWSTEAQGAEAVPCVKVDANDIAYILYTSGSTGVPKGVTRPVGGHMVAVHWSMANIMNVKPGLAG